MAKPVEPVNGQDERRIYGVLPEPIQYGKSCSKGLPGKFVV